MKRFMLVVSHLGADSNSLCAALDKTEPIQWIKSSFVLTHPNDLTSFFTGINHKYSNSIGMFASETLYNYQISHKRVYDFCNLLYLVRDPRSAVKISQPKDATVAINYYIFRLRRIYEIARDAGGIFLTWDDLVNRNGFSFVLDKLKLGDNVKFKEVQKEKSLLSPPSALLKEASAAYELCLFRFKKLKNVTQI